MNYSVYWNLNYQGRCRPSSGEPFSITGYLTIQPGKAFYVFLLIYIGISSMDFNALYVKESDAWTAEIAGIYAQYIIGDLELRQLKWQV